MATAQPTTDHDEIREWVESRGGHPARVSATGSGNDPGVLRIDFPGFSGEDTLEEIEWDEFFEWFDRNKLALLLSDEEGNRFNKLVSRATVNASSKKRGGTSKKGSSSKKASSAKRATSAKKSTGSKKSASSTKTASAKKSSSAKKAGTTKKASTSKKATTKKAAPSSKKTSSKKTSAKKSTKSASATRTTKKASTGGKASKKASTSKKATSSKKSTTSKKATSSKKSTSKKSATTSSSTSKTTTNRREIQRWVEARGGFPAHVRRTGRKKGDPGVLRIDYPGFSGTETLERISWEEWFDAFDRNKLAFLYQDKRNSRFSKLVAR